MPQFKAGDRVRAVVNAFGIVRDNVYTVREARVTARGTPQVRLVEAVQHPDMGWFGAHRFALLVEDAPVPHIFQVGEKARIVDVPAVAAARLKVGDIVTIRVVDGGGVWLEEPHIYLLNKRIAPVGEAAIMPPPPPVPEWAVVDGREPVKGDFVRAKKDAFNGKFKKDSIHVVKRFHGGLFNLVDLEDPNGLGMNTWDYAEYFELVEQQQGGVVDKAPVAPVAAPVGVGDWVVGAKVKCIRPWHGKLVKDQVYTVQDVLPNRHEHEHGIILVEAEFDNYGDGFTSSRFEIIKEEPPKKPVEKAKPKKVVKPKKVKLPSMRLELLKRSQRSHACCDFAVEYEDGFREYHDNAPCHAAIDRRYREQGKGKIVALVDSLENVAKVGKKGDAEYKAYVKYADYIINRSPFSIAFKPTTLANAFRYGVMYDVSKCIHIIAGGAVALREGTEFSSKNATFVDLVSMGYSEHTAFLISRSFVKSGKGYTYKAFTGGHMCLNDGIAYKDAITFLVKGWNEKLLAEEAYATKNATCFSIQKNVGKSLAREDKDSIAHTFQTYAEEELIGAGWDKVKVVPLDNLRKLADKVEADIKAMQ